jgi:penicillin-binding protein 1A
MHARRRPLALGLAVLALLAQGCHLPTLKEERAKTPALPQTSFLYAADGSLIMALHAGEDRVLLPTNKQPQVIRDAVVAIEDKRFYDHKGIDLRALLRAAYIDATTGTLVQGGSTITQQLVKNLYVGNEQSLGRKIKEAYLAWQLEHKLSKDQILTKYLNTVYFGNGAYGIQAAAQTYFGEDATALTLTQASLLAGVIEAPVDYDPVVHPTHARQRRNRVLVAMLDQGMIDQTLYEQAAQTPVELNLPNQDQQYYLAPYFVDYFKQWFLSNPRFGATPQERYDLLFKGGLRITTTLVPRLQQRAEASVHSVLPYASDPYAAMTVIDPRTGQVKAMVGGRDYWDPKDKLARVNLATGGSTGRQTGSAFKPFALVAALENGFTPSSPLNGSFAKVALENGTFWEPQNAEGSGAGTVSLETATVDSINIAYTNLEVALGAGNAYLGAQKIIETAKRMGIRCCPRTTQPGTPLQAVPAAVLGSNEMSTLEMASAYGTLAFGGQHVQPTPVISIRKADGTVLFQSDPRPKPVVNPAVISVADDILQKVVLYGTGRAANIYRPQIGKTGTNSSFTDAWFVGAVPQLVTAVWVGFPTGQVPMCCGNVRIGEVFGGTWPAEIWHAFMASATSNLPPHDFPQGPTVQYVTLRVDVTQGCLANPFTPPQNIKTFQYIAGTEPDLNVCKEPTYYQDLTVPSVIGLDKAAAVSLLNNSGFNVSIEHAPSSDKPEGTVLAQDPAAGARLQQTGTVTITVVKGAPSPTPSTVSVPSLVGMTSGAASAALQNVGLTPVVVEQQKCDAADPACDYHQGIVWSQSPEAGTKVDAGSSVTIVVNP